MKKHIQSIISTLLIFMGLFMFSSCHKEGDGGKAWVNGMVRHHTKNIPNAVVYIKYGASELPSTNPSSYDAQVTADALGHYQIENLYKGNYYLFSIGWDDQIGGPVQGGIAIDIKKNKSYELDIPVTE